MNEADAENIGPIRYYPERGFLDYQIASSDETSLEPLLAVYFEDLKSKLLVMPFLCPMTKHYFLVEGVSVPVECKLWTKHSEDKLLFEVMVD